MVAAGTVDELRTGNAERIDVSGPPPGWADALPGVRVLESGQHTTRVELDGTSDQDVLRAAMAAGPVHSFAPHRPPLTELYRDVVAAPAATEEGA
ncbi:DUF4162 domain-containing protein [Pseudonocardia sp. N23]|uniref:DUF4162 domain-containing protein n=1 Tax=Pseudonocardia sp. N23 TaxID=1987376 RepID=UPI0035B60552